MIFLDIETSSLNPDKHGILSLGAVDFENPTNQFYEECRLENDKEVDPRALEVNGFSINDIKNSNKKELKDLLEKFNCWVKGVNNITLAGHNIAGFDCLFLQKSFKKYGLEFIFGHRFIDLHSTAMAYYLNLGENISIKERKFDLKGDYILKSVGLPEEPRPHNALVGAKMIAETYSRMVFRKGLLKEFENYKII